jgi:hypothetical protein
MADKWIRIFILFGVLGSALMAPRVNKFHDKRCQLTLYGVEEFKGTYKVIQGDLEKRAFQKDKSLYTSGKLKYQRPLHVQVPAARVPGAQGARCARCTVRDVPSARGARCAWCAKCPVREVPGARSARCAKCPVLEVPGARSARCARCPVREVPGARAARCERCPPRECLMRR